jgi:flagellar hook-associated protein FlgK
MNFSVGISSLRTAQFAINTASQNIANANTEGYHRQRVILSTRQPQWIENLHLGNGVDIKQVDRVRNGVLEGFYTQSLSELSGIREGLSLLRQVESEFLVGDGSIHQAINGFFTELTRLSANPSERVARDAVIYEATQLANRANGMQGRLTDMKSRIESQLQMEVETLNAELTELVELQHRIKINSVQGPIPNDLLDKRDALVNVIAQKIDVDRFEHVDGGLGLSIGNNAFSIGSIPPQFGVLKDEQGQLSVVVKGSERKIDFPTGKIGKLLTLHNSTIGYYQSKLNELTRTLIREVDQAHAKGVGVEGPFEVLRSGRTVLPTNKPLSVADLPFEVQAGTLTVSITDAQG